MTDEIRVAIIGVGAMGRFLAHAIDAGKAGSVRLVAVADVPEAQARLEDVAARFHCARTTEPMRLLDHGPQLVIETARMQAVREYAIPLLEGGVDVLIMSAAALVDPEFLAELEAAVRRTGRRVHIPSGAIGGLDILRAAAVEGLYEARLTSSKPPAGLRGAPWFVDHPVDWDSMKSRTVLFRGSVAEAVRGFPQNVNVAAILNLAAIGAPPISVEVVADPDSNRNVQEVYARGTFGEMTLKVTNIPSPDNPKTSHLACLSPLALLRRLSSQMVVGS